jgi:hypothetical protein
MVTASPDLATRTSPASVCAGWVNAVVPRCAWAVPTGSIPPTARAAINPVIARVNFAAKSSSCSPAYIHAIVQKLKRTPSE